MAKSALVLYGIAAIRYVDCVTLLARWLRLSLVLALPLGGCLDWGKLDSGRCGDGFVGPEERCDDGNLRSGDGCDERCQLESGVCATSPDGTPGMCDAGGLRPVDGGCAGPCSMETGPVCGNSDIEKGEECDDGNARAGDGCDERCLREPARPLCGNGTLDADEVCDDANDSNTDACLNGCSRATCGDGQVRAHVEECDVVRGDDMATCSACLRCPAVPDGYFHPGTRHCYTRHTELASHGGARAICQADGGDLWTVTSVGEANAVVASLMLTGTQWLGRMKRAGVQMWVTGESTTFSHYAEKEPSTGACVGLLADGAANEWYSQLCATELPFVCERAGASVSLLSNRAYNVRTAEVSADEARSRCMAEGGRLVTLETPDEQAHVAGIARLAVWVDAREVSADVFEWSSGASVPPELIQMDDTDGSQGCLALEPVGQLVDRGCAGLMAFVCEFD